MRPTRGQARLSHPGHTLVGGGGLGCATWSPRVQGWQRGVNRDPFGSRTAGGRVAETAVSSHIGGLCY